MPVTTEDTAILVMDRGNEDVKLFTSLLEKAGFHVSQSADKGDILHYCRATHEGAPIVIIDTATHGLHLPELLDQVQSANPSVRVLLITDGHEPKPAWSDRSSIRGRLTRPFRRAQFLGSVLEAAKPLALTV